MQRGHYIIDDSKSNARADSSFRWCILSLLVFLLLCVIIIVIFVLINKGGASSPAEEGGHHSDEDISSARLSGAKTHPTPAPSVVEGKRRGDEHGSERPIPSTTSTSTSTSTEKTPGTTVVKDTKDSWEERDERSGRSESEVDKDARETFPHSPLLPPPTLHPYIESALTEGTTTPPKIRVPCKTEGCKELASSMLNTMGHGAEPCSKFYQYACGGLLSNKYLLEPNYQTEAFLRIYEQVNNLNDKDPESFKKFKDLEESCNNYDPAKDIQKWKSAVSEEINYLGNISKEEDGFVANFTHIFLGLLEHDRPIIFEVTLDVNDAKPSTFLIKMFSANLVADEMSPDDSKEMEDCHDKIYKTTGNLKILYDGTKKCWNEKEKRKMLKAAEEALRILGIFSIDEEDKLNETLDNYAKFLEDNIEAFGDAAGRRRELQDRTHRKFETTDGLNDLLKEFDVNWKLLIESLIKRPLKEDEKIQFYSETYFDYFMTALSTGKRQLHNALLVAFVAQRYRNLVEAQQRWRRAVQPLHCTRVAALLLPDVASALYLRSFDSTDLIALESAATDTVFEILRSYEKEFDRATWLRDHRSLYIGLEHKVNQLSLVNISGDTNIPKDDQLNKDLEKYTINKTDFVKNAVMLMKRNRMRLYERINKAPLNCIWSHFLAPYDSEAISIYSLKKIAIPLGVLQKPFFQLNYPPHIKTAGLGFVMAHAVAHHFDNIGIRFDSSNETEDFRIYLDAIPEFSMSESGIELGSLHVSDYNGIRGLKYNELLADRIGMKIAYKHFNKTDKKDTNNPLPETLPFLSLSNDQTFFLFLAQKHCTKFDFSNTTYFFEGPHFPSELRVKQLTNIKEFYEVFNCPPKSSESDFFPYSEPKGPKDESPGA